MIALIIVGAFLLSFLISHIIFIIYIFHNFFERFSLKKIEARTRDNHSYDSIRNELDFYYDKLIKEEYKKVSIKSFDNLRLVGYYYDRGFEKTAIFFHGLHANPFYTFGYAFGEFISRGYNVLIVDQRTHNESEGKCISYGFYESQDVKMWVNFAKDELHAKSVVLYGVSMGATSIVLASPELNHHFVKALVFDCGFSCIPELFDQFAKNMHAPVFLFIRGLKILCRLKGKFKFDGFNTVDYIKNNQIPTFFMMGSDDIVVSEKFLDDNYTYCAAKKYKLLVDNATHTAAYIVGKEKVSDKLFTFIKESENE